MRKLLLAIAAGVALGTLAPATETFAVERVKIGVLKCELAGGAARERLVSFIIPANRNLDCVFSSSGGGSVEAYNASFRRVGPAIGRIDASRLVWAVFAGGGGYSGGLSTGFLEGMYRGVSAEATIGVGLGANVLVGGFDRSITLQPLSVQTQQGLNIALGAASLDLRLR